MATPKFSSPVAGEVRQPDIDPDSRSLAHGRADLIEPDPNRPGPDRALLADTGIPVWAIVAHLQALTGQDVHGAVPDDAVREAAADYAVGEDLIAAALSFYRAHRDHIDARLARNAAAVA